jgi:hypothetical protein
VGGLSEGLGGLGGGGGGCVINRRDFEFGG